MTKTPRHAMKQPYLARWKKVLTLIFVGIFTFTGVTVAAAYHSIQSSITVVDNESLIGTERPTRPTPSSSPSPTSAETEEPTPEPTTPAPSLMDPFPGQALNILVMGSDIRDGGNEALGGSGEGMRSDTVIIAHISADRQNVELVSIPRDSWVDIPSCTLPNGKTTNPNTTKFNAAFAYGAMTGDVGSGAACTIKTIESLTGIYIDAWTVIDFSGFMQIVDALGGVDIEVDRYMNSPNADNLTLTPGIHHMDGRTALSYARMRKGEGLDGSDGARIDRQQQLFEAILTKAKSQYANVPALLGFTTAAASTLTTSENLGSVMTLAGLAYASKDATITFTTVPYKDRGDRANYLWTDEAPLLWERLIHDIPPVTVE